MKSLLACVAAVWVLGLAGCQGEMHPVATLANNNGSVEPTTQLTAVTAKGTYHLYSSQKPNEAIYQIDLKKGDQIGFSVHGDRAWAMAKGIRIELSGYSEGASYQWKYEEKKE